MLKDAGVSVSNQTSTVSASIVLGGVRVNVFPDVMLHQVLVAPS